MSGTGDEAEERKPTLGGKPSLPIRRLKARRLMLRGECDRAGALHRTSVRLAGVPASDVTCSVTRNTNRGRTRAAGCGDPGPEALFRFFKSSSLGAGCK